jgi:AcrR family transcriptional regulator
MLSDTDMVITRLKQKRVYRQAARAEQSEANTRSVLESAVRLLRSAPRLSDVTLDDIAAGSGVTVRTILRRFGTRDSLLEAAFLALREEIVSHRTPVNPGDIDGGLASMLRQYEQDGDLNLRVLEEEHEFPLVHETLEHAREYQRRWLEDVFGPHLAHLKPEARKQRLLELYAATDVYLWKLLRRDLRQSVQSTAKTMRNLVLAVLTRKESEAPKEQK